MQQCIKILLFHIYMKLNMFRATHDPLLGAWKVVGHVVSTYEKPEAANAVLDS